MSAVLGRGLLVGEGWWDWFSLKAVCFFFALPCFASAFAFCDSRLPTIRLALWLWIDDADNPDDATKATLSGRSSRP
jgi:hypothetical protein